MKIQVNFRLSALQLDCCFQIQKHAEYPLRKGGKMSKYTHLII
ncbi:hypothetical protein CLOM621_05978 [Clostridium sp. M62/1]|nr:hypothetical protein CLOM621_05978 [Clostridium sp. M62/1]